MTTERKPLYLTLDSVHQIEPPTTASVLGYDTTTNKPISYHPTANTWEPVQNLQGVTASFATATSQFRDGTIPDYRNMSNSPSNKVTGILMHIGSSMTMADVFHTTNPATAAGFLTNANLTATTQLTGSLRYVCAT